MIRTYTMVSKSKFMIQAKGLLYFILFAIQHLLLLFNWFVWGDYWILLTRKYLWINGKYGYSTLGTHESTHIHITHTCIYIYM
jgi:hypothetical protein